MPGRKLRGMVNRFTSAKLIQKLAGEHGEHAQRLQLSGGSKLHVLQLPVPWQGGLDNFSAARLSTTLNSSRDVMTG